MASTDDPQWILPAAIPFADLKGRDLEECVYWLLDAMGAKDLEWRTGGTGGGAADGGRDLEAHFYTPGADGEIEARKWWIECKGRSGTVDSNEVKAAVNNAFAVPGLDYLVIATNTQFSNPTRDWIKQWQALNALPKIKLWDYEQLERYLSKHPDVVLRLFSQALSIQGQFRAMERRFWNKLEFVPATTLARLWEGREQIDLVAMGLFSAITNEFANGSIIHRPWAAILSPKLLKATLEIGLANVPYLFMRSSIGGTDQKPLYRAFAYLILTTLDKVSPEILAQFIWKMDWSHNEIELPDEMREMFLAPIVDQLLSEMQDVCSSDCERMTLLDRKTLTDDNDEVKDYWLRFERDGAERRADQRSVLIERTDASCAVGFGVGKEVSCPLFGIEPDLKKLDGFLAIIKRVAFFRRNQSAEKRAVERTRAVTRSGK